MELILKKMRLLALIAAVITAVFVYYYLNSLKQPTEDAIEYADAVVALVDIPANTTITEEMVTVAQIPEVAIGPGTISDPSAVAGKVLNSPVYAGEQISTSRLVTIGEEDNNLSLEYLITPGMRAITIAVDETAGLTGMLRPGNHVDILCQYDVEITILKPDGSTEVKTVPHSVYLLENIKVLAVDSVMSSAGKNKDAETGMAAQYTTITLEVTPEQAQKASFSEYTGQLRAILRSPLDENTVGLPSLNLGDVVPDASLPVIESEGLE